MGFLQRGLLIYMCIAIAICMSMPGQLFNGNTPAENSVLSWFDLAYDSNTGQVTMQGSNSSTNIASGTDRLQNPTNPASSGSLIGFIDPVFQVWSWIQLIFKVLFSPVVLLTNSGGTANPIIADHGQINSPLQMGLMFIFVIPLVFMTIIGLIIWIRSGFA